MQGYVDSKVVPSLGDITVRARARSNKSYLSVSKTTDADQIDKCLEDILQTKFDNQLIATQSCDNDGAVHWTLSPRDESCIYGFLLSYVDGKIKCKHPLNTVSIWMLNYTLELLAQQFKVKIISENDQMGSDPHPEEISTFINWLRENSSESEEKIQKFYLYQVLSMPYSLRNLECNSSLHLLNS